MYFDGLRNNILHMKDIARELYIFYNQYEAISQSESFKGIIIDYREKNLLKDAISSLTAQLKILNSSVKELISAINYYQVPIDETQTKQQNLISIKYSPAENKEISLLISDAEKKEFLRNLSISRLSVNQLKKKYSMERKVGDIRKPNTYAKISNYFFKIISFDLVKNGYFVDLNKNLRKISSRFVAGTYVSMMFFTIILSFILSLLILIVLLFINVSLVFPFFSIVEENILTRLFKLIWIIIAIPLSTGLLFYFYPYSEAKNLGSRINQELPYIYICHLLLHQE